MLVPPPESREEYNVGTGYYGLQSPTHLLHAMLKLMDLSSLGPGRYWDIQNTEFQAVGAYSEIMPGVYSKLARSGQPLSKSFWSKDNGKEYGSQRYR